MAITWTGVHTNTQQDQRIRDTLRNLPEEHVAAVEEALTLLEGYAHEIGYAQGAEEVED